MKERSDVRQAFAKTMTMPDEHSMGVFKMLMDVYPAFSKKLFQGNDLMQNLVMSGGNPMDIMDYPICGSCETLAPWNGYAKKDNRLYHKCTCMAERCGKTTVNPITLREWCKYELKKKAPPDFIDALDVAIDYIALSMVEKHRQELVQAQRRAKGERQAKEILLPDGTEHAVSENVVIHGGFTKPHLPKDTIYAKD